VPATAAEWESYPGFTETGHAGIVVGDFNGDGMVETAVSGLAGPNLDDVRTQLVALLVAQGEQARIGSITALPGRIDGKMVHVPGSGGGDRLAAVIHSGDGTRIAILGGVPLRVLRLIGPSPAPNLVGVADVDADGMLEIVGSTTDYPYGNATILDYETGVSEWRDDSEMGSGGITQLDQDPALELILGGDPGRVVDGATRSIEWLYPGGFNGAILVGRFNNDPSIRNFAIASSSLIQIFRSNPFSPTGEFAVFNGESATVANPTADGVDQIAVSAWNGLEIHDPRDGHVTIEVEAGEPSAMTFNDVDSDSHAEVIFAGRSYETGNSLKVVDLSTTETDFDRPDESGPFSTLVRGDIAGDGSDEIAFVGAGPSGYYVRSQLHVVDAATGNTRRTRQSVLEPSVAGFTPDMALAQLDADPQREIILSGMDSYSAEVSVVDGLTLEDQWRVGGYGSPLSDAASARIALVDRNEDGILDVVAATSETRIVVMDGRNGDVLWESVTLDGFTPPQVAAFHSEAGTPQALLTVDNGIYLFDLATGLLAQSLKTGLTATGLWQWGDGTGCRFATLDENSTVTVYRCTGLEEIGAYPVPERTTFFRPIYDGAPRFLVASGTRLYVSDADGTSFPVSDELGQQIGFGNHGVLRPGADADHFDLVIGSDYMVTRMTISATDVLFANGFE
jgi:hypothetical protein